MDKTDYIDVNHLHSKLALSLTALFIKIIKRSQNEVIKHIIIN